MNFCTYFDSTYLPKGLVCYKTLCNYNLENLFIVCLDNDVYNIVRNLPKIVAIKLSEITNYDYEYLESKNNRTLTAFYITMSPILPLYIFETFDIENIIYTDADMAFWNDPEEILNISFGKSLMVTDHGIEPPRNGIRFNNGIIFYKNDKNCIEFLKWWREKCIEWCDWGTINGKKCGEQGYINVIYDEPNKFNNTLICPQPGINLGPWNVNNYEVKFENNLKIFNNNYEYNLVCYHYHEFRYISDKLYYPTAWKHSLEHKNLIYEPYFKMIKKIRKEINYGESKLGLTNIGK